MTTYQEMNVNKKNPTIIRRIFIKLNAEIT